jgi:sporulation protein YlmC with PRC-barrel domain
MMAVDSARIQGGRRASKLIGSNVYNENNESIGEVDDIIIPAGTNQPVAIISVGGFLGIGARLVAVPYERLQHATDRDRWTLPGATKDSLQTLPAYTYEDNRRG